MTPVEIGDKSVYPNDMNKPSPIKTPDGFFFAVAEAAIKKFNGFTLGNRELKVNVAKPREETSRSGGGGGYRDRRN